MYILFWRHDHTQTHAHCTVFWHVDVLPHLCCAVSHSFTFSHLALFACMYVCSYFNRYAYLATVVLRGSVDSSPVMQSESESVTPVRMHVHFFVYSCMFFTHAKRAHAGVHTQGIFRSSSCVTYDNIYNVNSMYDTYVKIHVYMPFLFQGISSHPQGAHAYMYEHSRTTAYIAWPYLHFSNVCFYVHTCNTYFFLHKVSLLALANMCFCVLVHTCLHVCVCVYIYIYIYIYQNIYIHTWRYIYCCRYPRIHACRCRCCLQSTYACIHTYMHTYIHEDTYIVILVLVACLAPAYVAPKSAQNKRVLGLKNANMQSFEWAWSSDCEWVCVCIYVYARVCVCVCMYVCIYIYTYCHLQNNWRSASCFSTVNCLLRFNSTKTSVRSMEWSSSPGLRQHRSSAALNCFTSGSINSLGSTTRQVDKLHVWFFSQNCDEFMCGLW